MIVLVLIIFGLLCFWFFVLLMVMILMMYICCLDFLIVLKVYVLSLFGFDDLVLVFGCECWVFCCYFDKVFIVFYLFYLYVLFWKLFWWLMGEVWFYVIFSFLIIFFCFVVVWFCWFDLIIFILLKRMCWFCLFKVYVFWYLLGFKLRILLEECLVIMCVLFLFLVGVLGVLGMELEDLVVYLRDFILRFSFIFGVWIFMKILEFIDFVCFFW